MAETREIEAKARRWLDLRSGETRPAVLAFVTLFGLVAAHTSLETARDALFLSELPPERLPLVYVIVAIIGLFVGSASTFLGRRFGRQNALLLTLLAAAVGTTLLYFRPVSPALAFGLYVWSGLLGSLAVVQFWLVTSENFTSSQSKRLFGAIGAGGVIGAVCGSAGAIVVLRVLPVQSLLLVGALVFVATAIALTLHPPRESEPAASIRRRSVGGLPLITKQPYLMRVAALVVLSTLALLVLDYVFKSAAARAMTKAELGPFFARYYAILNSAALGMQLFVAGRLMRRVGVVAALAILPLCLVSGSAAFVLLGATFTPLLLTKGADGAFRHSIHRVASELLYVPLDVQLRDRVKPVLDSSLGKMSQAAGAASLLGLSMLGLEDHRMLAGIVAGLAVLWFLVALTLRRPYLDLFRSSLGRGSLDQGFDLDHLDLGAAEVVMESLSSPEPARAIAAMNMLSEAGRSRLIPALILFHESDSVLVRALDVVPSKERQDWVPLAERLVAHESSEVALAAARALARFDKLSAKVPTTPVVRAYLAVQRARTAGESPENDPDIQDILATDSDSCKIARAALLDGIREDGSPRWAELLIAVDDVDDPELTEPLVRAMASVKDPRFVPLLIRRLRRRHRRGVVRQALVDLGDEGLDALASALHDYDLSPKIRVHLPRAIAEVGNQRAADILGEALRDEPSGVVRFRVLRALGRLVSTHRVRIARDVVRNELEKNLIEYLRLTALSLPFAAEPQTTPSGRLLAGLLRDKIGQALERGLRLLQLLYPSEDLRSVYFALESKDKSVRSNGLEFLDALVLREDSSLRELLHLVADDLSAIERVARAASVVKVRPSTLTGAIAALIGDPDEELSQLAAYHARASGMVELSAEATRVLAESSALGSLMQTALATDPQAASPPEHAPGDGGSLA